MRPPHRPQPLHRRAGFTLVELLVVMAIISILAALLLPVLREARESALSALCASQQKQMFLAVSAYADDRAGLYPPAKTKMAGFYSCGWPHALIERGYFEGSTENPGDSTSSGAWDDFFRGTMTTLFDDPKAGKQSIYMAVRTGDYGFNPRDGRRNAILRPSRLFLIGANRSGPTGATLSFGIDYPYPLDREIRRHNEGGNFTYHDGHVKLRIVRLGPTGSTSYGGYYNRLPFFNTTEE